MLLSGWRIGVHVGAGSNVSALYQRNNLSEQYRYYCHRSKKLVSIDISLPVRDVGTPWHDPCRASFFFFPDINYAFVSSSGRSEKRSIGLDKDATRRDAAPRRAAPSSTKRKRLKLKATVKNDGTLPREKTRAFIVRDSSVRFTSLFFLFISCPSSLSPCVFKSCLKYPLHDTSSSFTYVFILERDWSSIDENCANSEKLLFRMKKKGSRRTLSQIQSRANCVFQHDSCSSFGLILINRAIRKYTVRNEQFCDRFLEKCPITSNAVS